MAAVRRLKSSLQLGFRDNDNDYRGPNKTSLRRSNAKLQKTKRDAIVFDIPEEPSDGLPVQDIITTLKPWPLRPDPTSSSTNLPLEPPPSSGLPHDALKPDEAPTFTRKDSGQSESSAKRRQTKSLSKIFGRGKQKRSRPPDNFTKWDGDRQNGHQSLPEQPLNLRASGGSGMLASAILRAGGVAAGPSNPHRRPVSFGLSPYEDARRVRRSWGAARLDSTDNLASFDVEEESVLRSKHKERRQAIWGIDWSEFTDGEAIRDMINNTSPVDSGVGVDGDQDNAPGKGKGRAVEPANEPSDVVSNELDRIFAMQFQLGDEMTRQQREWSDRMQALSLQREEELEREHQRELDHITAEELAREEAEIAQAEEDARLSADLLKPRECVCCGDDQEPSAFPPHPPTYTCAHLPQTCTECMTSWLSSEFDSKGCTDLKCPECPETLSYDDIQRAASKETFLAYEKLLVRTALGSIPEFSWCLNPAGCASGQENSANNNFMECAVCKYRQCLKHQCAWHVDETCEQYEYRTSGARARDEEKATAEMLDSVSKVCPGPKCGWRIQKTEGCDHMTCRKCRWEFCWECLASHREIKRVGNTAHEEWCKFHSNNLETSWPFNVHR